MILQLYVARRFLFTFLALFAVFFGLMTLIEMLEAARRFGDDGAGLRQIMPLALLHVPGEIYGVLPLIVILSAITLFLGLARSSELVVARAAGRSALRVLVAPIVVTGLIGAVVLAAFNPIVAATGREYERRADDVAGRASTLALSEGGLWLRQGGPEGQVVIHAGGSNLDGTRLTGASFLVYGEAGAPERRIEAEEARLEPGHWRLTGAKSWPLTVANPEAEARSAPEMMLPSELTPEGIRDSFGDPSAVPVWELPAFIAQLRAAGFTAQRHAVHLQMELALPALLIAMVMIAAAFTLRHQRGQRTGVMVLTAVLLGFALYFLRNLARVLGETGQVAAPLAAWTPPLVAILLALGLLLHLEDG
ncbi:LPS export ABC transporter permease LptG [Pseudoroseicyclus aestuarii]|uniref:Lipopolysaccharide export system permease protein n=1 Tax=Pseudoroseicyclus aestuarii TaxID=1795041 RepID=A0A318SPN7_9RHOB|nr:LPS export ABC transporter permease LptG [Pseudoroseicyclus aestuarii]PYE82308.1 lipopolysaccharide export system permease protein [Pseudoroseicyclus aestuarii]